MLSPLHRSKRHRYASRPGAAAALLSAVLLATCLSRCSCGLTNLEHKQRNKFDAGSSVNLVDGAGWWQRGLLQSPPASATQEPRTTGPPPMSGSVRRAGDVVPGRFVVFFTTDVRNVADGTARYGTAPQHASSMHAPCAATRQRAASSQTTSPSHLSCGKPNAGCKSTLHHSWKQMHHTPHTTGGRLLWAALAWQTHAPPLHTSRLLHLWCGQRWVMTPPLTSTQIL